MELRILVIDDDEICLALVRNMLRRIMIHGGYGDIAFAIHSAANGRDGLEKVWNMLPRKYDLIISDYQMPYVDGLGVAAHMARMTRKPSPMLLITASDIDADFRRSCRQLGIRWLAPKPVDNNLLTSIVDTILRSLSRQNMMN